jgi:hypothetical protein
MNTRVYRVNGKQLFNQHNFVSLEYAGIVVVDQFNRDDLWHLCNWGCWTNERPPNVFTNFSSCGSDVIFIDEEAKAHLAMTHGWREFDNLAACEDWIKKPKTDE